MQANYSKAQTISLPCESNKEKMNVLSPSFSVCAI